MTRPALEFEPQPIEQLRARAKYALARVWDVDAMAAAMRAGQPFQGPGDCREHVFDFSLADAHLRVVLSIDHCKCHGNQLHVSASTPSGVPDDQRVIEFLGQLSIGGFAAVRRFVAPQQVLHLFFPWDDAPVFNGEAMTCVLCGRRGQATPGHASGWGAFLFDIGRVYACPAEIPRPLAGPAAMRFWDRLRCAVEARRVGPIIMPTAGRSQADCRKPGVN